MELTKASLTKFGFTVLAALMISACGSSGGGGNSDNRPQQNSASNNTQPNQSANNQSQQQADNKTGAAIALSGTDANVSTRIATLDTYNTTTINVDGSLIDIGYSGVSSGMWTKMTSKGRYLEVCCGKYSDTRFGVSDSLDENGKGYMFYNGNPTNDMPIAGTATYSGQSIITANIPLLDDEDFYTGSSKFNVDFGNKTLKGSLEIEKIQPVNIDAKISGNSFAGTANSSSIPSAGKVEGKFYGNNAKEMAGLATDSKSWSAAFGAQKQ